MMVLGAVCGLTLLLAAPARAQLTGSHTLGDAGVQAGTQPAPGLYAAMFYYRYGADTVKDRNGDVLGRNPGDPASVGLDAFCPILWYVSHAKVLGANVGAFITFPVANSSIEAPAYSMGQSVSTTFADMQIRPLDLGWHLKKADIAAGFQFYAPTGKYAPGAIDNSGKGMWSYEPFVGATVFFDQKRTVSLATTAYWEIHGEKSNTNIKVGQILTLEGGLGKSYLGGSVVVGAAYYAQWKLTADTLGSFTLPTGRVLDPRLAGAKNQVYALGPDVTLPVASKSKLFALVNVRYLWEMGARTRTQGGALMVTATFPVPSVSLKKK
jgi:hypothetical protein